MNQFTAQDWILIIGAIGVVLSNIITNVKNTAKLDAVNTTAKVIEGHVNSATTKADERAKAGEEREKAMQVTIVELRKSAALLAQALAIKGSNVAVQTVDADLIGDSATTSSDVKTIAENLEIKPKLKEKKS